MIYHVLPGDSLVAEFNNTKNDGEAIIFRDAMITGPIDARTPFEFWDARARFILAEYAEDEIEYHERVADEIERLSDIDTDDEVNLWFEYELFCSVNMWYCLSVLSESGSTVYRVEPAILSEADRWKGFGQLGGDELQRCYDERQLFTMSDLKLGAQLWNAYRSGDKVRLLELADDASPRFPYLAEVVQAAVEQDTKPVEIVAEIVAGGLTEFEMIFPEFTRRAGVYGFGDLQVQRILDHISS